MRCSACGKEKSEHLCPYCGFDESCNYELYGAFAPLSGRIKSVSGRKESAGIFAQSVFCPVCGFDESLNYEAFGTFAPLNSKTESLLLRRKEIITSSDEYKKLLDKYKKDVLAKEKIIESLKAEIAELSGKPVSRPFQSADSNNTSNNVSAGDVIKFGRYKQGKNGETEPIEWLVLAEENGKALLLSKYALDGKKYNEDDTDVTWETCTLRKWLNECFYNTAFSSEEQSRIQTTVVTAGSNPIYDTNSGNDTRDKVFLLSYTEAKKYFSLDEARKCAPTAYAKEQGVYASDAYATSEYKTTCLWWLRTPGYNSGSGYACYIYYRGDVHIYGSNVSYNFGIRPALWINL